MSDKGNQKIVKCEHPDAAQLKNPHTREAIRGNIFSQKDEICIACRQACNPGGKA